MRKFIIGLAISISLAFSMTVIVFANDHDQPFSPSLTSGSPIVQTINK